MTCTGNTADNSRQGRMLCGFTSDANLALSNSRTQYDSSRNTMKQASSVTINSATSAKLLIGTIIYILICNVCSSCNKLR